jgi:hypothetical protein
MVNSGNKNNTSFYELSVQSVTGSGCNGMPITCGQILTNSTIDITEMDTYNYVGTAGETISLAFWWSNGGGYGQASIYDPTGQFLTDVTGDNSGGSTTLKLPSTGTYTIMVNSGNYDNTSLYELSVQSVIGGGCGGFTIPCGDTISGQISQKVQMNAYELVATNGEHMLLSDSGFSEMIVNVYDPTGNNVVSIGASTSATYTFTDTGIYTVVVQADDCVSTGSYGLTEAVLPVCAALPTVSVTPANQVVASGTAAMLTAAASGPTPLEYQWRFGNAPIADATNNTYNIGQVQTNNSGAYVVVVSNPGGSVTSTPPTLLAVLTWTNPPAIVYGMALSSNQLNATATIPGAFAYSPPAGTVLDAGTNVLSVVFSPSNTTLYSSVTDTVSLVVSPVLLTITANNESKAYAAPLPPLTSATAVLSTATPRSV